MSSLLDHPIPTLPPPPKRRGRSTPHLPRWSRKTYRIIGAIAAGLFLFGMWLFYFSSVFALDSLVVEGVRTVSPAEVGAKADLGAGTPLPRVNAEAVQTRVMAIPAVASVQVTRRWPNTVVIQVVERDAVAILADGDRFATLDGSGFAYRTSKRQPKRLPLIEATDGEPRTAAVAVAADLPAGLRPKIETIAATDARSVVLTTGDGVTVMWGAPEDNAVKAQILAALLKRTNDKWIDLRLPTTPTSAQASPKPVPPPTPDPTPSSAATDGTTESSSESEVPVLPGIVPSTIAPIPQ
ncbi:MAG: FtsQ-type POTRA domain-containing protein [Actinobacteria bacterium]|nr:FtsQ-type POTRA domain-containing protein [Actinomycetota bacterium]